MKIYAIRDRLLDYYQQPFCGPDDKNVLAAVARTVNAPEVQSDISQAPHHFEVWELGRITEDGHIEATRVLVADCASLVRSGLRKTATDPVGQAPTADQAAGPGTAQPGRARPPGGATARPIPNQAPPETQEPSEVRGPTPGGNSGGGGHKFYPPIHED